MRRLRGGTWYFVAATFDAATGEVRLCAGAAPDWPLDPSRGAVSIQTGITALRLSGGAAAHGRARLETARQARRGHYNGKIDRPSLFNRALSPDELDALQVGRIAARSRRGVVAAWDFSQRDRFQSGHRCARPGSSHGTAVNLPPGRSPAPTGPVTRATSTTRQASTAPSTSTTTISTTRAGTSTSPSRIPDWIAERYLRRATAGRQTMRSTCRSWCRPPRGVATSRIAYLIPTFTYLAYANEHMPVAPLSLFPFADMDAQRAEYEYIAENHLNSLYDTHNDGSGVSLRLLEATARSTSDRMRSSASMAGPSG